MKKIGRKEEINSFERQLKDIKEWQENAYNPGHYIGTGRVPLHMKNVLKSPFVMLLVGISSSAIAIINLINSFSIDSLISSIIPLIIGGAMLYGGIVRLVQRRR
jgi:hypothetical protein